MNTYIKILLIALITINMNACALMSSSNWQPSDDATGYDNSSYVTGSTAHDSTDIQDKNNDIQNERMQMVSTPINTGDPSLDRENRQIQKVDNRIARSKIRKDSWDIRHDQHDIEDANAY